MSLAHECASRGTEAWMLHKEVVPPTQSHLFHIRRNAIDMYLYHWWLVVLLRLLLPVLVLLLLACCWWCKNFHDCHCS